MESGIYSYISSEALHRLTESFYTCVDLPIQIVQTDGNILESFGDTSRYCTLIRRCMGACDTCQQIHNRAGRMAVSYGEPYIFTCHANLNHIALPLMHKHVFLGYVLLGPFLMASPESTLVSELAEKNGLSIHDAMELFEEIGQIPVVAPEQINHISHLLLLLFGDLAGKGMELLRFNSQRLLQQSQINESIQRYKGSPEPLQSYPYQKERELGDMVRSGNTEQANIILNDLLGYVLFSQGNSLPAVKARAFELSSLMSRAAIESGAPSDSILNINNAFFNELTSISTFDDLCFRLQELTQAFSKSILAQKYAQSSDAAKKAVVFIGRNFSQNITLSQVAEHVHLNPAYFSVLFKQTIGYSFKEYLNMVRIEESKRLLANTNSSIMDIAGACGFEGQSYFSKIFRKYTGMTPKQFRGS